MIEKRVKKMVIYFWFSFFVVIIRFLWYNLRVFKWYKNGGVYMYFDPGTGSMIVQILVASIAGVGAFFLTFKTNCISFIKGIFKKNGK